MLLIQERSSQSEISEEIDRNWFWYQKEIVYFIKTLCKM